MKPFGYITGPELIWLLAFIGMKYFGNYNISLQGKYNNVIENMAYILPLILVVASMSMYLLPISAKAYLLPRIMVGSIIGAHFVFSYCAASHTVGGPGAGMIYITGICFTIVLVFVGSLVRLFFFTMK